MRLLLLNQFYAPDISPTAQLAASLAEHRAEQGDRVTVVTGRAGYLEGLSSIGTLQAGRGLQIRRVWTPDLGKSSVPRRLLGYASFLAGSAVRVLWLRRQDVIVAMTTPPFVVVLALFHKLLHPRTRVVLWSMDCYPDAAERFGELRPGGVVSRALRAANRWVFQRLDHVVCLDGAMQELLQSQYAEAPDRPAHTIIPNWERRALFPVPDPGARWPGYDEIGTGDRTVLLYLGNTGVGHRFDTVLDAAATLAEEAVFVFIGGGARWEDLRRDVAARGLRNVVLHSYVAKEETPAVMAGAHLALITLDGRSLGVMSPSKLHANLAAGLPVVYVGPPGSNVDEAIVRFGCGESLRDGDVDGFVAAVRSLRSDPGARSRARDAFEKAFNDEATLPQWDAVLDA
ncbi:MAG: glycosyltransferase family 4 protein [Acidimicrobiales bacterium]